ncbi:hypothetical protein BT93_D0973 [Corymbia citriodora subsp. variegata]|nr:hypothetical protein BT93_D0973 [Corymbia citriodora subsp. variegata]
MLSSNLRGFKAAFTIGEFKYLEKLCFVKSNIHLLKELWKLKELRRLGITKLRTKEGKLLCSSLDELKNLQSLNLHAVDEDEIVDLNHLSSPPKFLKHLYLHGRLEKLPDWIPELKDLTKVILRWSQLGDDRLVMSLGGLPNLVELELRRAYIGDELHFKDGQFPKLKILLLDELEGLRSMTLKEGAMPDLNMLTISRCPWLKSVPTGIEHLKSVQKLIFFDMPDQLKERLWADDEEGGYEKRDYMPEVYFGQYRAGHWEYCYID